MAARPSDEDSPSDEPADNRESVRQQTAQSQTARPKFSLFNRTRMMGVRGLEASVIGWVLAGCIVFGFLVGSAADRHFGTTMWMPVGVMVGIAAGFREMFVTLGKLSKQDDAEREAKRKSYQSAPTMPQTPLKPRGAAYVAPLEAEVKPERERIFKVPPPPTASFEGGSGAQSTLDSSLDENMDTEALIEKLSHDDAPSSDEDAKRNDT